MTTGTIARSRWESAWHHVREQLAADPTVRGRRGLQLCLGVAWLLDAALQFQPFMFRPSFVTTMIEPAAIGNPRFVTASVDWAGQLMLHHLVLVNAVFATVQLLIAIGLFWRRSVKPALALSILWALSVWWFGESLGGILVGASPLSGVPGAVLLYALAAVLVWPSRPRRVGPPVSVAAASPAGPIGSKLAWVALWGTFAHYLLLPANRAPEMVAQVLSQTYGQPGWLAAVMSGLSRAASNRGLEISVVLALLCVAAALGPLAEPLRWPALVLATTLGLLLSIAEGLGGIFTGRGTDPNSGPLLILLVACYLPRRSTSRPEWPRARRCRQWPSQIGYRAGQPGQFCQLPRRPPPPTVVAANRPAGRKPAHR